MYENKRSPLASKPVYYKRIARNLVLAMTVIVVMVLIGIAGYYWLARLSLLSSFHNASMILSGMGPILPENYVMPTEGVWFSSIYAIFSGVIFISTIGFILAPVIHRFFHKLHLEER